VAGTDMAGRKGVRCCGHVIASCNQAIWAL
jgi:hypothetical protein